MAAYNNQYNKGDAVIFEGRYLVIRGVRVEDGETQYRISKNGRVKWYPAALLDRNAKAYDADT